MKIIITIAAIVCMSLTGYAATTGDVVAVSALVIPGSGSFVDIKTATIEFGSIGNNPTNYRFNSSVSTCEFFAANGPWSIRVYATNGYDAVSEEAHVLRGEYSTNTWMAMKFWQPNFGPQNWYTNDVYGYMPPVMEAAAWNGMKWVVDEAQPDAVFASSAASDVSGIPFNFAVDAMGAATGAYTANIFFELTTP